MEDEIDDFFKEFLQEPSEEEIKKTKVLNERCQTNTM